MKNISPNFFSSKRSFPFVAFMFFMVVSQLNSFHHEGHEDA